MNDLPFVSVIVATRNRPNKIRTCIQSIINTQYPNMEILVLDQSHTGETEQIIKAFSQNQIRYFRIKTTGVSRSKNLGILKAKYSTLCFTDDDCMVDKNWIREIIGEYQNNLNIDAVFGQTLPLTKDTTEGKNVGLNIFKERKFFSSLPSKHLPTIVGNNWSIKRSIMLKLNGFKSWLGPGSIGFGAEEDDILYQLLRFRRHVAMTPNAIIYHSHTVNRWKYDMFYTRYGSGFFLLFTWYVLKHHDHATIYLRFFIRHQIIVWAKQLNYAVTQKKYRLIFYLSFILLYQVIFYIRGIILGFGVYFLYKKN